jgi:dihydrofolate reductase
MEESKKMRKVILGMNITLDGYVVGPNGEMDFFFRTMTPAQFEMVTESLRETDTIVLGRNNYLEQASYWPTQTTEMAALLNSHAKIVVSKTLDKLEWNNSRLATADIAEEIAQLKQQPGKNIVVTGGPTLAQSLLRLGLIEEITLTVHPIVLGSGTPLFPELLNLKLISTRTFDSGAIALAYQPVRNGDRQPQEDN